MNGEDSVMGLSAAELEALKDDDTTGAQNEPDNGATDDTDLDDDKDTGSANDPVAPDQKPQEKADTQTDEPVTTEEKPADFVEPVAPVEDFDQKMADLNTKEDQLSEKFDDGELTQKEFRQQLREIDAERRSLENQHANYERQMDMKKAKWKWEIDTFMDQTKKKDGIDYKDDDVFNAALDKVVRKLAQAPENQGKPDRWFLDEAHKEIKAKFNLKSASADPKADALRDRKPNLDGLPPSLGTAPAAQTETGGDEFAHLDSLQGMALERALAKMTSDQVRRYLEQ